MNDTSLNIEDVRAKCNVAIDYLEEEISKIYSEAKTNLEIATKKMNDFHNKHSSSNRVVSDDFLKKVAYAIKIGLNIFAMTVLKVDREFLDFSSYKSEKKKKLTLPSDSPIMCSHRVLESMGDTFNNVRDVINTDDTQTLSFYRGLIEIGYGNYPFWNKFFELIESLNVKVTYSKSDRKKGFSANGTPSPDRYLENGIINALRSNNEKTNGMIR